MVLVDDVGGGGGCPAKNLLQIRSTRTATTSIDCLRPRAMGSS